MSDWLYVAAVADFPVGERRLVAAGGTRIAVFHLESGFHAIEDVCSHDGGELASGELAGHDIICPRHGARFDLRTGAVTGAPAYEPVAVLPVRVVDGRVEVRDDRWD